MYPHKLTNKDIVDNYQNIELILSKKDFTSALAYWINRQNHVELNLDKPINAYSAFLDTTKFFNEHEFIKLKYDDISALVSDSIFESIPEIMELNQTTPDFICLGALSRNVFFMILRESITQEI